MPPVASAAPSSPLRPAGPSSRQVRAHLLSPADFVECPTCGGVLRRFHAGPGSFLKRCESDFAEGHPRRRAGDKRCGQHLYGHGDSNGLATAYAISRDEYDYLSAVPLGAPKQVLEQLRVIRRHDRGVIERRACASCGKDTARTDLYSGVCRWCEHGTERPAGA